MKYTSKSEKDAVKRAVKVFLAQEGTNLKRVCEENGIVYASMYQKLNAGNIDKKNVDLIISLVNPSCRLMQIGDTYVINKSLAR